MEVQAVAEVLAAAERPLQNVLGYSGHCWYFFRMALFLLSLLLCCSKLELLDWWTVSSWSSVVDDLSVMIGILVTCCSWSPTSLVPSHR